MGVDEVEGEHRAHVRHEHDLHGDHQRRQDHHEQEAPIGKAQHRQGEAGQGRDHRQKQDRAHRRDHRIQEILVEVRARPGLHEVVERRVQGQTEAIVQVVVPGLERVVDREKDRVETA